MRTRLAVPCIHIVSVNGVGERMDIFISADDQAAMTLMQSPTEFTPNATEFTKVFTRTAMEKIVEGFAQVHKQRHTMERYDDVSPEESPETREENAPDDQPE